jgi:hypothetical protein
MSLKTWTMDAKQEFPLKMMKLGRKVLLGPDTKADLEDCDVRNGVIHSRRP